MGWIVLGGVALLYFLASMSRRRKQEIVQAALSRAVRSHLSSFYATTFGTQQRGATPAEIDAMAACYFHSLLEFYGARDFSSLMRAMTVKQDQWAEIEERLLDRLAALVPGAPEDSGLAAVEKSRLRLALTNAGEEATQAGRASGEI